MYKFKAYKWNNKIFINEVYEYLSGEILTWFLNFDIDELEKRYTIGKKNFLYVKNPLNPLCPVQRYNQKVYAAQTYMTYIEDLICKIPPYDKCISFSKKRHDVLFELLNKYGELFKDGKREIENEYYNEHYNEYKENEYGYSEGGDHFWIENFIPDTEERKTNEADFYLIEKNLNDELDLLFNKYIQFTEDILRIHYVFKDFLDNYIHTGTTFPNQYEIAKSYELFMKKQSNETRFKKLIPAGNVSVSHGLVFTTQNKTELPVLCKVSTFETIGTFLYTELFDGLETGFLPKKCRNCGKYFLLTSGYYNDFCDEIAPNEQYKTCKDVGARKKFDDKVKSDPIWLTYQRAYKTHYARVMKKKMSKFDFSDWTDMAIELRGKAIKGEISFKEFEKKIKE